MLYRFLKLLDLKFFFFLSLYEKIGDYKTHIISPE